MAEYIERGILLKRIESHLTTDRKTIGKKQFADGFFLGLSEAEIMVAQAPAVEVEPVRSELRKVLKLLEKNYEQGLNSDYVREPITWTLYQTWKEMDGGQAPQQDDDYERLTKLIEDWREGLAENFPSLLSDYLIANGVTFREE